MSWPSRNKFQPVSPFEVSKDELRVPSGKLQIAIRNVLSGEVERVCEFDNVIVNSFRPQEVYALAGDTLAGRVIDTMQLGTSSTPAAATDGAITNGVSFDVTSFSYPSGKSVQFTATLPPGVGNGVAFQEAGLFHNDTTLAARRTFPVMTKSATFEWSIRWTITWP